jgi:hypothetical protein
MRCIYSMRSGQENIEFNWLNSFKFYLCFANFDVFAKFEMVRRRRRKRRRFVAPRPDATLSRLVKIEISSTIWMRSNGN